MSPTIIEGRELTELCPIITYSIKKKFDIIKTMSEEYKGEIPFNTPMEDLFFKELGKISVAVNLFNQIDCYPEKYKRERVSI